MERLNEIMGRAMPRRSSHPTQQLNPYQGQYPALPSPQTEPDSRPSARRRLPEQAPQSSPPDSSTRSDTSYSYGNGAPFRPNQPYYTHTTRNKRQSYEQEAPHNRFNGPDNYTRSYEERDEPEVQTFTHDVYSYNRYTTYPSTDRTNEVNDGDMMYRQNAQISTQRRQNYPDPQTRQEHYFHHADVNHYVNQPEADDLYQDEMEDEEELQHMGYGDWEVDNHQILPYRRPDSEPRTQTRRLASIHETAPAYTEPPTQSARSTRHLHDIRNGTGDNKRPPSVYGFPPSTEQPQSTQSSQRYPSQQQVAPLPAAQPTMYKSQGQPTQSGRQGRSQQHPYSVTHEQEAPHNRRMTQPLNPQTITDLNRQREYAAQLNQARMRQTEAPQQVQPLPPVGRKETQTGTQLHPVQPARQISQSQPSIFVPNKPLCTKCKGAGYLRANVPFGHPNFGKAIACECKEAERKEKRRQQLREMSNLDAFRQKTFSTFNAHIPGVQEAYRAALDFETKPKGWLVLSGPNGCGKTHLAAAIANQALDNGAVVLFEAAPDLLDHLRAAFAPAATEVYDQLFSKMREAELLILDDLGAQQSSPWANEKLFQLLNYRYNLSMATVITGNPKGIQGVDERIRSRLSDAGLVRTVIMDRARDYRPQNPHR
jgi:DNA replication protein DnaC